MKHKTLSLIILTCFSTQILAVRHCGGNAGRAVEAATSSRGPGSLTAEGEAVTLHPRQMRPGHMTRSVSSYDMAITRSQARDWYHNNVGIVPTRKNQALNDHLDQHLPSFNGSISSINSRDAHAMSTSQHYMLQEYNRAHGTNFQNKDDLMMGIDAASNDSEANALAEFYQRLDRISEDHSSRVGGQPPRIKSF